MMRNSIMCTLIVFMLSMIFHSGTIYAGVFISVSSDASSLSIKCEAALLEDLLEALKKETGITYQCPSRLLKQPIESNITMMPFNKALKQLFMDKNTAFTLQHGKVIKITILNDSSEVNEQLYPDGQPNVNMAEHRKLKKKKKSASGRVIKDYTWHYEKIKKMQTHLAELERNGEDTIKYRKKIKLRLLQLERE